MAVSNKGRSVMALFSAPACINSHRARFVLAEKGINVEIVSVDSDAPQEDLADLNPYNSVPTLVDRDLILYDAGVITEYLDERYPHPPLMPVDPVSRARLRLALFRIRHDWYTLAERIENNGEDAARKQLRDGLSASAEVFSAYTHFLNEDLTLVDCAVAPLLWRLPHLGVELPRQAKPVMDYCERVFSLQSFRNSLSSVEKEMQ